jgi:Transcriptional regulator
MDTTLLKGLKLLEILARSPQARGTTDLAGALGVPKSNAHRTLQSLIHAGFVQQDENGLYECTSKLFELGNAAFGRQDIRKIAAGEMQRLASITKETIHLSILDRIEVIYIDKIESPQPVRAYSEIGGRAPAHCVASGKAQLAFAGAHKLDALPDPLPSFSSHTRASRADLNKELVQIRELGYAVNRGEWRESVGGVASPIFDATGRCVAAIGVSGPTDRMTATEREQYSSEVLAAARAVTRMTGGDFDLARRSTR